MSESGRTRAFFALPRDLMWVESARDLVARVRAASPEAAWTRESAWHVTLKFLGEISRFQAREFAQAVSKPAAATVPGELHSGGAAVFPPEGPARVLGVAFAPSETLHEVEELAAEAERQARRLGLREERRRFHPHVTLARLRRPWPRDAVDCFRRDVEAWSFPAWPARSCVLYESRLDRDGAVHTPVQEWSFAGVPRGVRA